MTDDERDRIAELKVFAWAAPTLLPIIARRKKIATDLLLADFRLGKTDLITRVATLEALSGLETEITQKTNEYDTLKERK